MTIKDINRSQAIYKMLVEIDSDIIKLDKRAIVLADHSQPVGLTLTFEGKPEKVIDEDGSLTGTGDYMRSMYLSILGNYSQPEKKKDTFDIGLSDVEALGIIGFLINLKK